LLGERESKRNGEKKVGPIHFMFVLVVVVVFNAGKNIAMTD